MKCVEIVKIVNRVRCKLTRKGIVTSKSQTKTQMSKQRLQVQEQNL